MDRKYDLLHKIFGWSSFREGQEPLVDALLAGRDVFGVMPTGGGKSLCYQLPAMLLPGVTLVVSPLISLMKDQVMALTALGVPAAYINSSQTGEEARRVYTGLRAGEYKLLYIAPERLTLEGFTETVRGLRIPLVAVDEAHCISQWGQDFRPSYLKIPDFISRLPRRPSLAAFTATATPEVREDVERLLGLRSPVQVVTGFDRPNLRFDVLKPHKKYDALLPLLRARRDKSGIVYCSTRREVERVCEALRLDGFAATRYHAGLEDDERRRNQEDFIYDRSTVMVATNAFGMGIDKSNVGFVIHYNMPKSLEAYYQEAGRAGRDGSPADCILLFSPGDIMTARHLIETGSENPDLSPEEQAQVTMRDYKRLEVMSGYCATSGCYRAYILDYFGQAHTDSCSNCGNCSGDFVEVDMTREAQMVLSCVLRVHDKLGYYVGQSLITHTLRGSRDKRVLALGLDGLSTYGILRGADQGKTREYFDALLTGGYLRKDETHATLIPTESAREVLFRGKRVLRRQKRAAVKETPRSPSRGAARREIPEPFSPGERENGLLEALKLLRLNIAREEGVPLYVVFSNATLMEMVRLKPRTMADFLAVPGVGTVKAKRYGEIFMSEIGKFV